MSQAATFLPKSDFHRDLSRRVDEYFTSTGRRRRDDPRMYLKTAVMLLWLAGSYVALVFLASTPLAALLAAASLGVAMAGVGFNIQHDGNHGAYSEHPLVNKAAALTLDLLGGTAYFWHYKHNLSHHTHPNIDGHDDDINVGPLARMAPQQKWRAAHRFQHLYMWLLYAMLALEWQITGEFRNLLTKSSYGQVRVPRPAGRELVIFWVGKVVFFGLAFGLPLLFHPWWAVLTFYVVAGAVLGLVLAVVFQLAHCSSEATFREVAPGERLVPRGWAEHQVETTVNFARDSRLANYLLGGLNFQIEHHLFPKICHVHYAALSPIVESVCRAHGVRYFSHPTFLAALRSHARFLREMGRGPGAVAVEVSVGQANTSAV